MHEVYCEQNQTLKEAMRKAKPDLELPDEEIPLRDELKKLRAQNRHQETKIIRMKSEVEQLQAQLTIYRAQNNIGDSKEQLAAFSKVPILLKIKELEDTTEEQHQQIMRLSLKVNELNSQIQDLKSNERKIKNKFQQQQLSNAQNEAQRQRELDAIKARKGQKIVDPGPILTGIEALGDFMRAQLVNSFHSMFQQSLADQSQKASGFSNFNKAWLKVKSSEPSLATALCVSYLSLSKLARITRPDYALAEDNRFRDTINAWALSGIQEIWLDFDPKAPSRQLFRLLSLYYRTQFPAQNEHYELEPTVKAHIEHKICELISILLKQ